MLPKIADFVAWRPKTEIPPGVMNLRGRVTDVENCDVGVLAHLRPRGPNYSVFNSADGTILSCMLIHGDDLGVGQQPGGPSIGLQRIAAHDQRRTEDGPKRQHRSLLIMAETRLARLAPARG